MKNIGLLVRKDFKRKWKNPIVILGFMLMPALFTFIFGMVFGSSDEALLPRVNVLLADNDKSIVSNFLISAMSQGELKDMVELEPIDTEERGRVEFGRGSASALLNCSLT